MCCTWLTENKGHKNYAKNRRLRTIAQLCWAISSQLRHVLTIRKNLLIRNITSTCPHNTVNFGPLMAETDSRVSGTPSKFQRVSCYGFVTEAMSLSGGQSRFSWCLDVSLAAILYIHFQRLLPPKGMHFASKSCTLLYWQCYCTALQQWVSAKLCSRVRGMELLNFCKGTTCIRLGDHHFGHRPTF